MALKGVDPLSWYDDTVSCVYRDYVPTEAVSSSVVPILPLTVPHSIRYVMGPATNSSKGNYWTAGPAFPATTNVSFYLGSNNTLQQSAPSVGEWRYLESIVLEEWATMTTSILRPVLQL